MTEIEETDEGFQARTMERAFKRATDAEAGAYAAEARLEHVLRAWREVEAARQDVDAPRGPARLSGPAEDDFERANERFKAALAERERIFAETAIEVSERSRVLAALHAIRAEAEAWREDNGERDDAPDYASGLLSAVHDIEEAMR